MHYNDRLWPPQLFYICTMQCTGQMPHITHVNNLTEMFFILSTINSSDLFFLSFPFFTFQIDFFCFKEIFMFEQSIFTVSINTRESLVTFYFHSFKVRIWLYVPFIFLNIKISLRDFFFYYTDFCLLTVEDIPRSGVTLYSIWKNTGILQPLQEKCSESMVFLIISPVAMSWGLTQCWSEMWHSASKKTKR